ncbi:S8 family serine peptidase [Cellulomonas sp. P5_C6]
MNRRIISAATALGVGLALTAGGLAPAVAAPATPTATAPDPTTGERPDDRGPVPEATFPEVGGATYDPDHVLVKFAPSTTGAQQRSALEAVGGSSEGDVDGTPYVQVAVGDEDPVDVVARLDSDPRVAEVQLDHVRHAYAWTNDPLISDIWPYLDTLRLPRAWDASTGSGITIAVLDTGVSPHEDLALLPGYDFVDGDASAADPNGHGTLVAGVAAARGNNGAGAVGAAYDAKILPVRVLDATGVGDDSTIANGIAWAAGHGAGVINLSLGGTEPSPILRDAISAAVAAGAVVVAAAGNGHSQQAQYPAAYAPQIAGLLAVSATDDDGSLAAFSSWGDWVSIAAPGESIVGPSASGGYVYRSGTSFSAPFVAGAAALVRAHATMTPAKVEERLETTARDAGPRGTDPYYGFGVLDAASAVTTADPVPAAVAVPFDRMPGDGVDNDTPATAGALAPQSVGTIAPEGDVDWYRATIGSAGWYRVEADILAAPTGAQVLDLAVEVRSPTGTVLRTASVAKPAATEKAVFPMTAGGDVLIGISNANPSASDQSYRVMLFPDSGPATFTSTQYEDPEWASSAAAGDLTGDGIADVVTSDYDEAFFRLQRGNGDGTLASPVEVAIPAGYGLTVTGLSTADVDGDGDLDVLVTTVNGVGVFTQAGGVLTAHGLIADTGAWDTIPIDADGDGDRDLVITG